MGNIELKLTELKEYVHSSYKNHCFSFIPGGI